MRINFVLPRLNLSGGIRVLAVYAQMLQARGHRVAVRSPGPPLRGPGAWLRGWLRGETANGKTPNAASHFDGLALDHRTIAPARPITDRDVPDGDVVVATWWETVEWVARLSSTKGAKVHFIQHDESMFHQQPTDRVLAAWQMPMDKIVVSRWLAELAHQRDPRASVHHVPNSVDTELFDAPPRGKQATPTVGLMYSKSAFKGLDVALEAIERARRQVPALQVVGFGMDDQVSSLPMPETMRYFKAPPQKRIPEIYRSADAWLFASRSEGFGLPLLEAMACRTPVIATPAGAAPDLLEAGGGWLLPHLDDIDGMAAAIVDLAQLPDASWQALSQQAYTIARDYDWSAATDRFEAALQQAVQGAPARHTMHDPATLRAEVT
jgi:glycosyltransferase involved in cell wall biosynthesis